MSDKITVRSEWVRLFKANHKEHLTDEEIGKAMSKAFPQRKTNYTRWVAFCRSQYNLGKMDNDPPKSRLLAYNDKGEPLPFRARGPRKAKAEKAGKSGKKKVKIVKRKAVPAAAEEATAEA